MSDNGEEFAAHIILTWKGGSEWNYFYSLRLLVYLSLSFLTKALAPCGWALYWSLFPVSLVAWRFSVFSSIFPEGKSLLTPEFQFAFLCSLKSVPFEVIPQLHRVLKGTEHTELVRESHCLLIEHMLNVDMKYIIVTSRDYNLIWMKRVLYQEPYDELQMIQHSRKHWRSGKFSIRYLQDCD